ncbi:transglutaminase family protein [Microbacterium karelineae]|uniref:transglutaminase family protein n=1 Tax=Microbacterium karelineae TaxID=2654283 RepID=UPI0012E9D82E|nr:transglutaminase family protein [Microbacterium karelineae]
MQLRIRHTTGFDYADEAVASYNEARMLPATTPQQTLLRGTFEVLPVPWSTQYSDYWGTTVTAFEVHEPHLALTVVAHSLVETTRRGSTPKNRPWAAMVAVAETLCEFLEVDEWVRPPLDLLAEVAELRERSGTPSEYARAVARFLHDRVAYLPGATTVSTTAADAWSTQAGVCQDLAHLMIGVLRTAGIPARYVSGYLHPSPVPIIGELVAGESHAWVEWWDGVWTSFDPTNDLVPAERHVVVARGRAYPDCPPLRGIYSSGGSSALSVSVEVTRVR